MHQGQLSYVIFADSKTLVTAGSDCTISIWAVVRTDNLVDLQPKICLFGHRSAVIMLAVSRSFSALLSASSDGKVLLWDLNRLEMVRELTEGKPVEVRKFTSFWIDTSPDNAPVCSYQRRNRYDFAVSRIRSVAVDVEWRSCCGAQHFG
jgi:WD40 repeat protein